MVYLYRKFVIYINSWATQKYEKFLIPIDKITNVDPNEVKESINKSYTDTSILAICNE